MTLGRRCGAVEMAFHSRRGTANMLRRDDVMEMPQFDDTFQTNSRPYSDVGHRLNFDVDPTLLCTVGANSLNWVSMTSKVEIVGLKLIIRQKTRQDFK